ncbi:MAG TPA: carboxypeptidase regulatory-like domain-containing protein [Kofleriaceae bacterium]
MLLLAIVAVLLGWGAHHRHAATATATDATAAELGGSSGGSAAIRTTNGSGVELGTIDGRVVDEANAPLAGVRLCARTPSPQCTLSGTNGAFTIANLAVHDLRKLDVAAQLAHYSVVSVHDAAISTATHTDTTVTMKSGAVALTGFVRDVGGGPIARAMVTCDGSFAETDHDGAYTLWTSPALNLVEAGADGYVTWNHYEQPPTRLDFSLFPEATISGRVVDATTGQPMPFAVVRAHTDQSGPDGSTVADSDGRFDIDQLSPALYSLRVDDPHATAMQSASLPITLGEHVDGIVVRVISGFEVSGRVTIAATGEPCTTNPSITLTAGRDTQTPSDTADGAGVVHVGGLAAGTYRVEAACDHHLANAHYDDIVVTDHDVTDRVWTVTVGARITGRVVDDHGAPVKGVDVSAGEAHPIDPNHRSSDGASTAADGSFELGGLRPVEYQLSVARTHGGIRDADTVVVALSADQVTRHDFVIDDSASGLVGHVRFADGSPAQNVDVTLTPAGSDATISTSTSDNGRFEISDLQGDYYATIFACGTQLPLDGAGPTGVFVHITPSSTSQLELTTTATTGEIRGHVVDDHGQPVDDAFVALSHYDESTRTANFDVANEVFVAADGSFRVEHLVSGSYRARAYRRSGGEVIMQPVELGSDITLTLATTGSVTGIARLDGMPLQRLFVTLDDPSSPSPSQKLDVVALDGQFSFDSVPPGHYRLTATADLSASSVELDVITGQATTLTIELDQPAHVHGRIISAATDEPLPHSRVLPTDANGKDAYTDANGQFELLVAPRGPISLWIMRADDTTGTSWSTVTSREIVVDADVVDLGDIRVAEPE